MKICHPLLDTVIDFNKNSVCLLAIENNKEYYNLCLQAYAQSQGGQGDFCLSKGGEILDFAKNSLVLYDFLNVDFTSKKVKSTIDNAVLEELKKPEYFMDLATLNSQVVALNDKVLASIDLPLDFSEEFGVEKFIKLSDYYVLQEQTLLEKLITYIDIFIKIKKINFVVFVGLFPFLSQEEINLFISQLNYMQIKVLFLENKDYCVLNCSKIIIDKDLCQI